MNDGEDRKRAFELCERAGLTLNQVTAIMCLMFTNDTMAMERPDTRKKVVGFMDALELRLGGER